LTLKAGEHVVGERPISREELASSGNLIEGPSNSVGLRTSYGATSTAYAAPAVTSYAGTSALAAPSVIGAGSSLVVPEGAVYGGQVAPAPAQYVGYSGGEILGLGASVTTAPATYVGSGTIAPAPAVMAGSVAPAPAQYMGYVGGDIITAAPAIVGSVAPAPPQYLGYAGADITYSPPAVGGGLFNMIDRNHDGVITRSELNAAFAAPSVEYIGSGDIYGGSYGISRPLGGSITSPVGTTPLLGSRYPNYVPY